MNPSPITPDHTSPLQQAGVEPRDLTIGAVRLREVTNLALARLRVRQEPRGAGTLPGNLPDRTGQCSGTDPVLLCLGPGEWLAISASSTPAQLVEVLQSVPAKGLAAAYDLTPGFVVLRLTGAAAPWLLSKLSCLDFIGGTAEGEHCARTRMGDTAVTVHYHPLADGEWAFDVLADRSIAAYLWALLGACAPHANELTHTFGVAR